MNDFWEDGARWEGGEIVFIGFEKGAVCWGEEGVQEDISENLSAQHFFFFFLPSADWESKIEKLLRTSAREVDKGIYVVIKMDR